MVVGMVSTVTTSPRFSWVMTPKLVDGPLRRFTPLLVTTPTVPSGASTLPLLSVGTGVGVGVSPVSGSVLGIGVGVATYWPCL